MKEKGRKLYGNFLIFDYERKNLENLRMSQTNLESEIIESENLISQSRAKRYNKEKKLQGQEAHKDKIEK